MELQVGSIVRYVGVNSPELAGMEGLVHGVSGYGTACRWTVEFAGRPGKEYFLTDYQLRAIRNYSKSIAKKYLCPRP